MLVDKGICDLAEAWHLVSSGPAAVLGWSDRGRLQTGSRADFVILDTQSRRVAGTFVEGRASYLTGGLAERLLA